MKFFLIFFILLISSVSIQAAQENIQKSEQKVFLSEDLTDMLLNNMYRRYAKTDKQSLIIYKKELEKQLRSSSLSDITRQRLQLELSVIEEKLSQPQVP